LRQLSLKPQLDPGHWNAMVPSRLGSPLVAELAIDLLRVHVVHRQLQALGPKPPVRGSQRARASLPHVDVAPATAIDLEHAVVAARYVESDVHRRDARPRGGERREQERVERVLEPGPERTAAEHEP